MEDEGGADLNPNDKIITLIAHMVIRSTEEASTKVDTHFLNECYACRHHRQYLCSTEANRYVPFHIHLAPLGSRELLGAHTHAL